MPRLSSLLLQLFYFFVISLLFFNGTYLLYLSTLCLKSKANKFIEDKTISSDENSNELSNFERLNIIVFICFILATLINLIIIFVNTIWISFPKIYILLLLMLIVIYYSIIAINVKKIM